MLGPAHAEFFQNGQEVQQRGLTGREDGFDRVGAGDFGRGTVRQRAVIGRCAFWVAASAADRWRSRRATLGRFLGGCGLGRSGVGLRRRRPRWYGGLLQWRARDLEIFSASVFGEGRKRWNFEHFTYLSEIGGFSTAVPLALYARAPLYERLDAPSTVRAYPPTPNMTIQVTTVTTTTTRTSTGSSAIIATTASTTAGITSLRDMLAPDRNRALRPVLKHQFLHEVIPPFRGAPARRERRQRQWQRRRGHERVCRA